MTLSISLNYPISGTSSEWESLKLVVPEKYVRLYLKRDADVPLSDLVPDLSSAPQASPIVVKLFDKMLFEYE